MEFTLQRKLARAATIGKRNLKKRNSLAIRVNLFEPAFTNFFVVSNRVTNSYLVVTCFDGDCML